MVLSGKKILITRAAHQAEEFVRLIKDNGAIPILFPTIEILPPDSWETCDRALDGLYMYDGLIFTSTNGVEFFVRRMVERGLPLHDLQSKMIFVVGDKTKHAIELHECTVTAMPEKFTAMELANVIQQEDLHGKCFLFPKGNLGNTFLADTLKLLGAHIDQVTVYRTQKPKQENVDELRTMAVNGTIDVITFTSPSTVKNFAALFTSIEMRELKKRTKVAVIGPVTAEAAEAVGLTVDIVAEQSSVDALLQSLLKYFQSNMRTPHSEMTR
jgi:uroporphyrinogen-III synthase